MEKLKSLVPNALRQEISESTPDGLPATCSSLLEFFHRLPQFHQACRLVVLWILLPAKFRCSFKTVKELTDPEMALCGKDHSAASELKLQGNECFSRGDYPKALHFYTQALRFAPTNSNDTEKNLAAMLYVNRASALHKMGLIVECLQDCDRALAIFPTYAKAWFRRGKANASLGNFEDAIQDLNVSLKMEVSLSGKRQIEDELRIILDQHKLKHSSSYKSNRNESDVTMLDEPDRANMQCVCLPTKGRGMVSLADIPIGSLVHKEDPYAAIILKNCRETNCHFCFNELPMHAVPCESCSIPLYCSSQCQLVSGGKEFCKTLGKVSRHNELPDELEKYISECVSIGYSGPRTEDIAEHRHECEGVHWPAVLPSEVVLAGRVLVKFLGQQKDSSGFSNLLTVLDLCHNFVQLPPDSKLEMHIYSIILLNCLRNSYAPKLPVTGVIISQLVILLSQIRVNSMAIVRMKSLDTKGSLDTSTLEQCYVIMQVKVGQAIYLAGSMFNHSCRPNAHAYFLSRTLYVRTTDSMSAGSELELSYGPQVGQWDHEDRQQILRDRYSFSCQCRGCSQLNLSDLCINAYRCAKPDCLGVVPDSTLASYVKQKLNLVPLVSSISYPQKQVEKVENERISDVAHYAVHKADYHLKPGHCLNCDLYRDLEAARATISKAESSIRRLQDAIASNDVPVEVLSNALKAYDILRSTLHPFNKRIAEVEDNIAQAMCLVGEPQAAMDHCKASIKILEKLYDPNHIVIGNELIKLGSIQLQLGNRDAASATKRAAEIFSRTNTRSSPGALTEKRLWFLRFLWGILWLQRNHTAFLGVGCDLLRVAVALAVVTGVLAGDAPLALGDGAVGHDLRMAGKDDTFFETFFTSAGLGVSLLEFADSEEWLSAVWVLLTGRVSSRCPSRPDTLSSHTGSTSISAASTGWLYGVGSESKFVSKALVVSSPSKFSVATFSEATFAGYLGLSYIPALHLLSTALFAPRETLDIFSTVSRMLPRHYCFRLRLFGTLASLGQECNTSSVKQIALEADFALLTVDPPRLCKKIPRLLMNSASRFVQL
nr:SET and MYND domain-containing protein 4 isoform X1 [Ipomoea batatas]